MKWFDQTCLVPGVQPPLYVTLFILFPATDLNSTIEFGHLLKAKVSRTQVMRQTFKMISKVSSLMGKLA